MEIPYDCEKCRHNCCIEVVTDSKNKDSIIIRCYFCGHKFHVKKEEKS